MVVTWMNCFQNSISTSEFNPDLGSGGQSCDEPPWPSFFSFFSKSKCNRNGLKQQCVKYALSHFVVLAGSCSTVVSLPNASQASKTCSPLLGWQVRILLYQREARDYPLLLAVGCSAVLVICSRDALAAQEFLSHSMWVCRMEAMCQSSCVASCEPQLPELYMLNLSKMRHAAQCSLPSFVSLCSASGPSCGSDSCPYLSKSELNPTPDPSPTLRVSQTGLHTLQPKILIPCAALCLSTYPSAMPAAKAPGMRAFGDVLHLGVQFMFTSPGASHAKQGTVCPLLT